MTFEAKVVMRNTWDNYFLYGNISHVWEIKVHYC